MQLYEFTKPELDKFRELCNFTDEELDYFNLRSRKASNIEISLALNMSTSKVSLLARSVKSKMKRVL